MPIFLKEANGGWDFQISDLIKNPDGTDYLTPVVNFCEVQRAQLAKSTPHLHVGSPGIFSDRLRSFQMLKREWGAKSNAKLPLLFIPSETATLVPEFAV